MGEICRPVLLLQAGISPQLPKLAVVPIGKPVPESSNIEYLLLSSYVFFLYAQSSKFKSTSLSSSFTNWDMANYTKAAGLGDPLGGTFMMLSAEV